MVVICCVRMIAGKGGYTRDEAQFCYIPSECDLGTADAVSA